MDYKSYPTAVTMPSRKLRKSERNRVYQNNYKLRAKLRREKRSLTKE